MALGWWPSIPPTSTCLRQRNPTLLFSHFAGVVRAEGAEAAVRTALAGEDEGLGPALEEEELERQRRARRLELQQRELQAAREAAAAAVQVFVGGQGWQRHNEPLDTCNSGSIENLILHVPIFG